MASLITQVKSKLFIDASKKSMHALDGAFASLLHGRSLDFEDLRQYQFGDQVRDIDWRATARMGEPLIKRSRAMRMHTVLFVVDTGLSMTAIAEDERPLRELAVLTTGALGVLTLRHGDDFSMVYGDAAGIRRVAPGRSEGALEHGLRRINAAIEQATAPSDRDGLLSYVSRTISRRMIVVIVTDDAPLTDETERLLRRLRVQHDVVWATLKDAEPVLDRRTARTRSDVVSRWQVPDFAQGDADIVAELRALNDAETARRNRVLDTLEISHLTIGDQQDAVGALLRMLHRRANAGF